MKLITQVRPAIYVTDIWIVRNGKRRKYARTIPVSTHGGIESVRNVLGGPFCELSKSSGDTFQLITRRATE